MIIIDSNQIVGAFSIKNIGKVWGASVIIFAAIISFYLGFYITTSTAFPENPATYTYFIEIAEKPYIRHDYIVPWNVYCEIGGDCDDRAYYFRQYLESKGKTDIETIVIQRVVNGSIMKPFNDTQGHTFILWNGRVYDPHHNKSKRFFNADLKEYLDFLKAEYGYNTLYFQDGRVASF